jgi:hypothetical protein
MVGYIYVAVISPLTDFPDFRLLGLEERKSACEDGMIVSSLSTLSRGRLIFDIRVVKMMIF